MQDRNFEITIVLFLIKISEISKSHGMGQTYIQGQLEEACHQLTIQYKKNEKDFHYGF